MHVIPQPSSSSVLRRAIVALVASAAAVPASATTHVVDPIAALIREYARDGASAEYIERDSDEAYERYVLTRPDFPYADEVVRALSEADGPTRRAVDGASTSERPVNQRDLHNMKVSDLGFTKARLGYEIHWTPEELQPLRGATSATKAGIEPDIYAQAIRLSGTEYPAIAANYAVAAQALRAKLASTPRERWGELGLRPDVLDHFVHAVDAQGLSDHDLYYLMQFLDGAMATWDAGHSSVYGLRELPVLFRVGRLAAAYRERNPYENDPCLRTGKYDPTHAGMGGVDRRPLCFPDATDRAVHAWYVTTLRAELLAVRPLPRGPLSVAGRMAEPLRSSGQGWVGIRRPGTMAIASRKEVVEAKIANNLLIAGDLSYRDASEATRRALRLTCRDEL